MNPSSPSSVKIQCVDITQQCFALFSQVTFPSNNLNFDCVVEADEIESRLSSSYIFSTLLFSLPSKCVSTLDPTSKHLNQFKKFCNNIHNCYNLIPFFFCNILIKALKGPVYVQNALSQTHDGCGGAATTARLCDGNSSESETDRQSSRYSMEEVV